MSKLREAAQQALEALESLHGSCTESDSGTAWAVTVWCPEVLDALRAALAEPQSGWDKWQEQKRGCSVCGIGANGETVGYVCTRNDCPTRVTCGGTQ